MFQNIADMNAARKEKTATSNVQQRLKEIFRYQNIIIYILTLLMSTLSIKGEIVPFGLAMLAACVGEGVPLIMVFIMAIIGTCIGSGTAGVGNFLVTSIVYFLLVLLFRVKIAVDDRNEEVKTGGKLFTSCLIVSIIKSFIGIFLIYDVFMAIISASIVYVFYKIFVNGLSFIKNLNIKKAFTIEELIAGVLIVSVASIAFSKLSIFSLSITNIIIIFMIMVLGWKYGMVVGAVSGIAIGLTISLVDGTSFVQISMFAISGILSGLLNKFGKLGVIVGFILGNAILTYWVRGASPIIINFREVFIASIGLLLVPNKIKIEIEDLVGSTKLLQNDGDRRLEEPKKVNEDVSQKLKIISDIFKDLATTNKKNPENYEDFIQDFLDNIEELQNNIFYDLVVEQENGIAEDICRVLIKNDIILDKDVIEIFKEHNNYVVIQDEAIRNDLQEIVKIANRTLKITQINKAKEEEKRKNEEKLNDNIKTVAKLIDNCVKEIAENKENIYYKKEQEIMHLLNGKNVKIDACNMKKLNNEKYIIELKLDYNDLKLREKATITNISDVISKSVGAKVTLQRERKDEEKGLYYQVYSSEDKFVLQVGSARVTKDGSDVSGDCSLQIKLADGKYLLAISDGMGSGVKARELSKITLRLIKQMLSAGFDKEESVNMINARLNMSSVSEIYASLDVSILDLYVGKLEILKNGACNTYIKNKKTISKIESRSLPVGIVENIELQSETVDINDGDILIMCSDGVLDGKSETNNEWIEDFLKNVSTNNVQKIADLILAEAIDNSYGVAHDDMTVIVSKIVKRK